MTLSSQINPKKATTLLEAIYLLNGDASVDKQIIVQFKDWAYENNIAKFANLGVYKMLFDNYVRALNAR